MVLSVVGASFEKGKDGGLGVNSDSGSRRLSSKAYVYKGHCLQRPVYSEISHIPAGAGTPGFYLRTHVSTPNVWSGMAGVDRDILFVFMSPNAVCRNANEPSSAPIPSQSLRQTSITSFHSS